MKVRLCGAGAVGLTVAHKLKDVSDFRIIASGGRLDRYKRDGFLFNGKKEELSLISPDDADKADLLIVAVKNFHLSKALEEIAPFVSDDTMILSLLNGIDAERVISERFGAAKVLYSFITDLSATHENNSTVCFSDGGIIIFGEKDNSISERVKKIAGLFDDAGQRYMIPADIMHEKWWKFTLNCCFNTLSATIGANYMAMSENAYLVRAVRMIANEILSVAKAEGVSLSHDDVDLVIKMVLSHHDKGKTSMLQDVEAGRMTENDYFLGTLSRLGRMHGILTPCSDLAYNLLEARRHALAVH